MDEAETEADTCRRVITPRLQAAGWDSMPHQLQEQRTITPGRILFTKGGTKRGKRRRLDYLLRYRPDVPIAVVEAKASYLTAADGMQQAKLYATMLGLKFAYASNGADVIEYDFITGLETPRFGFPTPTELWDRQRKGLALTARAEEVVLTPGRPDPEAPLRYYQEVAVTRAVEAIASSQRRALLTLCTGAGKTPIAFQVAWRLHAARWTAIPGRLRARILFLADRDVLVKDPQNRHFAPFGQGRHRILAGHAPGSREIFFATYHALLGEGPDAIPFTGLPPDFFDLIIVDECHRGSARADSTWRTILEHFSSAAQLGMTATPLHEDARDTYAYFGPPLYVYSLKQGIEDGYLAPYKVRRVVTDFDAAGWRPTAGELDRYGQPIPDDEYQTKDFERVVALRARTQAIARHLTDYLRGTDPFAKTLVFCVDQEHADEMRRALANLNSDLMAKQPDWVCRVTSDEGDVGRTHLEHFQDVDRRTPAVLTTSQMLTTGVDAPTVKNVVLVRVVGSMSEFKQIIGRGTRVREDYGKTWFTILDYTGTATANFADPAFDGDPVTVAVDPMNPETGASSGPIVEEEEPSEEETEDETEGEGGGTILPPGGSGGSRLKYYVDSGTARVVMDREMELDADGKLVTRRVVDRTRDAMRTLYPTPAALRTAWGLPDKRKAVAEALAAQGLDVKELAEAAGQPEADPFDLLCHIAWGTPPRTRRERAEALKRRKPAVFERFGTEARAVLDALLDRYEAGGPDEMRLPEALKIEPLSAMGNPLEIAGRFGGPDQLRQAVIELQEELYAA